MNLGIKIITIGIIMLAISIVVSILTVQVFPSELLTPEDLPEGMAPIQPVVSKFNPLLTYSGIVGFATIIAGIVIWRIRK